MKAKHIYVVYILLKTNPIHIKKYLSNNYFHGKKTYQVLKVKVMGNKPMEKLSLQRKSYAYNKLQTGLIDIYIYIYSYTGETHKTQCN